TDEPVPDRPRATSRGRPGEDSEALRSLTPHSFANLRGRSIQFESLLRPAVVGPRPDAESVASEPREHVEVQVEDLLACLLSIGQPKIHRLAPQSAAAERGGHLPCGFEDRAR